MADVDTITFRNDSQVPLTACYSIMNSDWANLSGTVQPGMKVVVDLSVLGNAPLGCHVDFAAREIVGVIPGYYQYDEGFVYNPLTFDELTIVANGAAQAVALRSDPDLTRGP